MTWLVGLEGGLGRGPGRMALYYGQVLWPGSMDWEEELDDGLVG